MIFLKIEEKYLVFHLDFLCREGPSRLGLKTIGKLWMLVRSRRINHRKDTSPLAERIAMRHNIAAISPIVLIKIEEYYVVFVCKKLSKN